MGAHEELARRGAVAGYWANLALAQGLCIDEGDDQNPPRVAYSRKSARYVALNPRPGDPAGEALRALALHKDASVRTAVESAFVVNEGIAPQPWDFIDDYKEGRAQLIAEGWNQRKAGPEWLRRQAEAETGFRRANSAEPGASKSQREIDYDRAFNRMTVEVFRKAVGGGAKTYTP